MIRNTLRVLFVIFLLFLSGGISPCMVQAVTSGDQSSQPKVSTSSDLGDKEFGEMRVVQLEQTMGKWSAVPIAESAARFGVTEADVEDRITVLAALQNFYRRLSTATEKTAPLKVEVEKRLLDSDQAKLALEEKPPYTLTYYDSYLRNVDDLVVKKEGLGDAVLREQKAIVSAQDRLTESGKLLRLAQSEFEKAQGTDQELAKQWLLQKAELQEELWQVTLAYLKKNLENLNLQKKAAELRLGQVEEARKYVYGNLIFDKNDLESGIARHEDHLKKLSQRSEALEAQVAKAETAYAEAHANLSVATGEKATKKAQRIFALADLRREYLHLSAEQTQEMIGFANEMRDIWIDRCSLLQRTGVSADVLIKERDEVKKRMGRFEDVIIAQQKYQAALFSRSAALDKEQEEADLSKAEAASLKERGKVLDAIMVQNMAYMALLIDLNTMNQRLLDEIVDRISTVDITEKVSSLWRNRIAQLLNTELWYVGGYAVRLKEFVIAMFILVLGLLASRRVARFTRRWLLLHSKRMEVTVVHAIEQLLYYILLCSSFLVALKIVNVPLTAFAFLGGAIAIAVGFGAQNLFNNLISGFIIMIHQPFKINDIVQFEDVTATVLEVDSRSTKVRTFDSIDVVVPNSYFLENRITNWTLSDKVIRGKLEIGVAYGTPARKVEELLLQMAKEHKVILNDPKPYVLFSDYGASSMDFILYFWVDIRRGYPSTVTSDLRYKIQDVFDREGIEIPFPQMDLYVRKLASSEEFS